MRLTPSSPPEVVGIGTDEIEVTLPPTPEVINVYDAPVEGYVDLAKLSDLKT